MFRTYAVYIFFFYIKFSRTSLRFDCHEVPDQQTTYVAIQVYVGVCYLMLRFFVLLDTPCHSLKCKIKELLVFAVGAPAPLIHKSSQSLDVN